VVVGVGVWGRWLGPASAWRGFRRAFAFIDQASHSRGSQGLAGPLSAERRVSGEWHDLDRRRFALDGLPQRRQVLLGRLAVRATRFVGQQRRAVRELEISEAVPDLGARLG
jgi:hypothetical protein